MLAKAPLPKLVHDVGDRIGLNYRIDRKTAAAKYIEESRKASRLDIDQLKNSYYSLNESRTRKEAARSAKVKKLDAKNQIKLSSRVRKSLYKLTGEDKQQLRYTLFEEVHKLWLTYADRVVHLKDPMSLFRMDFHGCKLTCTASRNPTLVGAHGIVVQETKNTFQVIKETNRLLTIPKRESIFQFRLGCNVYRIHGCNFLFTTQARSKVKYKQKKCPLDI